MTKQVRHIVSWSFREGFTNEDNQANARRIKSDLESLVGSIQGLEELSVHIDPLPSSNRDIILVSLFESEEAYLSYEDDPTHRKMGEFVGEALTNRACVDFFL